MVARALLFDNWDVLVHCYVVVGVLSGCKFAIIQLLGDF